MKAEIAKYPSADENKIIASLEKVDTYQRNTDGADKSKIIVESVQEALDKLNALTGEGDTLTNQIANIETSIETVAEKLESIEALEKRVDDANLSEETDKVLAEVLSGETSGAKNAITSLEYSGDSAINKTAADNIEELAEKKVTAAIEADGMKTATNEGGDSYTRSKESLDIIDKCVKDIAAITISGDDISDEKTAIDSYIATLKADVKEQDEKDAGKAALNDFCTEKEISLDKDERIADTLEAMIDKIQKLDKGTATDEEFEAAVAEVVQEGKNKLTAAEFRYDNPVTEKKNAVFTTADNDALNAAKAAYDKLTADEQKEVDELYKPAYQTFAELVSTKLFAAEFNARKDAIIEELEGKRKLHDGPFLINIIDGQEEFIDGIYLPENALTSDEQKAKLASLEESRKQALEEVRRGQAIQQTVNQLDEELGTKKDSGCYSSEGIEELEKIFKEAKEKLESVTSEGDWKATVLDDKAETEEKYAAVKVIAVATNGVTPVETSADTFDYDEEYNADENGYIGTVSNSSGMDSSITLIIKKTEDKEETEKAVNNAKKNGTAIAAEGSDLSMEDIEAALDDKDIKITLDAYLVQNGEKVQNFDGSYTVKVLIPTELRGINGLQVVYVTDDGKVEVYDTKLDGNYLVFTTSHFSDFQILGERHVNLLWVAILLCVVIVAELIAIYQVNKKRREKTDREAEGKKEEPAACFAGFGGLLTVYLPDGIITTIIVLAVIVVAVAGLLAYVALRKLKPREKKEEVTEEAEEAEPLAEQTEEKPFVRREYVVSEEIRPAGERPWEESEQTRGREELAAAAVYAEENGEEESAPAVFVTKGGGKVFVMYDYSFKARLIQSPEDTQRRYHEIREYLLSYGLKCTEGWKAERYYCKGKTYAKMTFRGKTLCVNLAISPAQFENTKYHVEDMTDVKKYADIPCLYRIKNERRCVYAKQLTDTMLTPLGFERKPNETEFAATPYETRERLIDRKLIRVKATAESGEEILPADFAAMKEHSFITVGGVRVEKVAHISAEEAAASSDEIATAVVVADEYSAGRNKSIVNIDKISENYKDGDVVTVANLREKGLIPKKADYVKVLARGTLDKALIVKAQEYSADAIKMIVLVGGTAIRIKVKRK